MDAAHQWVATTTGRIATCPYSWMQSVHWVAGSGLYTPSRKHGPKWGETTIRLAQELSALTECRPGISYLARKLGVSERTVQYHLDMLREAGLLAYLSKGTRIAGSVRQASHFERIIPVEFDMALGIRTVQLEGARAVERRPVGIAEETRGIIAELARKAARKVRRKRSRGRTRCTPMQVGTSTVPPTGLTRLPSESKLENGKPQSPTKKQQKPQRRTVNRVGRRHQLARELITAVPWLAGASSARIAWIVRHVADAGWSCTNVQALLAGGGAPQPDAARRPSGLLAYRLKGAHLLWDTAAKRARGTENWRDSMLSRKETTRGSDDWAWGGPARVSAQAVMREAIARLRQLDETSATVIDCTSGPAPDALDDLSREEIVDMRAAAMKDRALILTTIDLAGENYARRLYTNRLVDQALTDYAPTTAITW